MSEDFWVKVSVIRTFVALFIIAGLVDYIRQVRKTCPSDGLVGLICGSLRSREEGWVLGPQKYFGFEFIKGNVTVSYSDFMGEGVGLEIDGETVPISPSSQWALLKVVKPLIKAYNAAKRAEAESRKLQAVIRASQEMLH